MWQNIAFQASNFLMVDRILKYFGTNVKHDEAVCLTYNTHICSLMGKVALTGQKSKWLLIEYSL